jgi:hypothetical protein
MVTADFSFPSAAPSGALAIFRYSARFLGEDFVLANSMHSAANSRKSVDGSQSSKVIPLSSFGIFLDIGFMGTPAEIIAN